MKLIKEHMKPATPDKYTVELTRAEMFLIILLTGRVAKPEIEELVRKKLEENSSAFPEWKRAEPAGDIGEANYDLYDVISKQLRKEA